MQTEINELKESMSDISIDNNSNNKTNSNSAQVNNNSEKAADRDNKYNEKVKETRTLKAQLVKVEDALKESERQLKETKDNLMVKELELSKERQFVQMLESNRTNSRQLNNNSTSKNDCLTQNDKNAVKDIVTETTREQIEVSNIDLKQYIASGQPHNNMMQRDVQHKNPQTLKNSSYCLEAFDNCTNRCRYGRKCKYSHDIDFQKLKKFGLYKFELKAKGNCKNSDKCKWSHQTPKPLYREKTVARDASPYTKYSQNTLHSKLCVSNNLPRSLNESNQNIQPEKYFLSQMKDIAAFYKNRLMEVKKSTTKNQITDIPRHQRSANMEQPHNNAYMNQPLNAYMNQNNNQHCQLNCHQQFPTLPTTNNQTSYQPQHTQPQQQCNPPQNPLITIPSYQNIRAVLY